MDSFEGSCSASVEKLPYTGAKLGPFPRELIPVVKDNSLKVSSASCETTLASISRVAVVEGFL